MYRSLRRGGTAERQSVGVRCVLAIRRQLVLVCSSLLLGLSLIQVILSKTIVAFLIAIVLVGSFIIAAVVDSDWSDILTRLPLVTFARGMVLVFVLLIIVIAHVLIVTVVHWTTSSDKVLLRVRTWH